MALRFSRTAESSLTNFGPNNTVTVETAVILRKVTNADAESTRPATAAQLAARQALLPRTTFSADVVRRREQLLHIQNQCVDAADRGKQQESKFQQRLPLVHLGVELKVPSEPVLSPGDGPRKAPLSAKRGGPRPPTGGSPHSRPSVGDDAPFQQRLFDGFEAARDAAAALNAVDNLLPKVVQANPYLQHLREVAEDKLKTSAAELVRLSSARETQAPSQTHSSALDASDLPEHHRAIFSEWSNFVSICKEQNPDLHEDTQRELFVAFVRSRGRIAEEVQRQQVEADKATPRRAPPASYVDGVGASAANPLDDLVAPSRQVDGGGAAAAASLPAPSSVGFTTLASSPLRRAKMMLPVTEKRNLLQRLMEKSVLGSHGTSSPVAASAAAVAPAGERPLSPPKKTAALTKDELERESQEVVRSVSATRARAQAQHAVRAEEERGKSGMRLQRRRNIELYRQEQQTQHQLGLLRAAQVAAAEAAARAKQDHDRSIVNIRNHAGVARGAPDSFTGPPGATHKLKSRGSSAKSRPSSSSTSQQISPRPSGVASDFPTIATQSMALRDKSQHQVSESSRISTGVTTGWQK